MNTTLTQESGMIAESSRRPNRLNQIIFLFAALILLNALLSQSLAGKREILKIGDQIPSFKVSLLGGGTMSDADFIGNPAVFFFYADWCPCSHKSVPYIKKAKEEYKASGIAMLGVGIQDSSDSLKAFAEKHQLGFPVTVDDGNALARLIGVKTTPTTIFADSNGVVRSIFVGQIEQFGQVEESLKSITGNLKVSG